VLSQQEVEVCVLILDDCSLDHTPDVAADLVREDPRVEYRRHAVNQRHIDTYNEGLLEWASGDYALLLSADDLLAPGALRRAVQVLDAYPEVGLVHGRQRLFESQPEPVVPPIEEAAVTILSGKAFIEDCCAAAHNPVATPTAVVRTSVQRAVGGYRKTLPHTADMEMWLRFAARSAVARIEALQAFKRVHASNMQHQYAGTALGDLNEQYEAFESFFREDGHLVDDNKRLQFLATRSLAESAFWSASRAFDRGDEVGCRECLDYVLQLCPVLKFRKEWNRLRWKRRLGPRVWNLIKPLVDRLRCSTSGTAALASSTC
jgi:hypothetical protein